mgnify:CR=1 FL=1
MKNIEAVLKQAGVTFQNVVKTTIFLTDMKDFPAVNEIYGTNHVKAVVDAYGNVEATVVLVA